MKILQNIFKTDGGSANVVKDPICGMKVNLETGEVDKEHSTNPVPFIAVGKQWQGQTLVTGIDSAGGDLSVLTPSGMLADISPTILKILEIEQPKDMTGSPLV